MVGQLPEESRPLDLGSPQPSEFRMQIQYGGSELVTSFSFFDIQRSFSSTYHIVISYSKTDVLFIPIQTGPKRCYVKDNIFADEIIRLIFSSPYLLTLLCVAYYYVSFFGDVVECR